MIDANEVQETALSCMFRKDELGTDGMPLPGIEMIEAEGIIKNFGFHKARLEENRERVINWLNELPDEFHKSKGGGWTFLNACMTKKGDQWGEHESMELLFCLGIGLDIVKYLMPRELWKTMPGGMPYIVINTQPVVKETP